MGDATFTEALRRYRLAAGLSQDELATRADLSSKAISALERGERRNPYLHTIRALADALGLGEDERNGLMAAGARRAGTTTPPASPQPPYAATSNLPVQLSPLIGRDRETSVARRLLARSDVRLLTLTGPGGVGKTRLALRLAGEMADDFPDGVTFVALASLTDPGLVPDAIIRALSVPEVPDVPLLDNIVVAMRGRHLLLVLDNFEHLTEATPDVASLLVSCPELTMLVTSRAALRLRGEQEYRVPPLGLPAPGGSVNPNAALASDAVQLFVSRAAAVQPGFVVTPANAETIAAICRRLDGLPLAIELAAARVRLLSPAALLARLDRTLPLLTDGPRDVPTRQRTMRDAIAWSYNLLSPEERTTFARMAVFVGGGTLAACETVCTGDDEDSFATLDRLTALLDNNLLTRETTSDEEDGASGPRIRMLEPIREYAAEQLSASGEREALRRQHATYFLSLAEHERTDQSAWLRQIGPEYDNLRAALRWAFEQEGETENAILGLRLVAALWWFWEVRGHLTEGRSWIERALRAAPNAPSPLRAEASFGGGALAIRQRDYTAADKFDEQSLTLWRALGDSNGIARALTALAEVALRRGDLARASSLLAESMTLRRVLGDKVGLAESVNLAALVARDGGDYVRAEEYFEEALTLWREVHRPWGIAVVMSNLGHLNLRQGDATRASALLGESLELSWELGASWSIAYGLEGLAGVAAHRGDFARAARLWGAAEALRESIGAPLPPNLAPHHEAIVTAARAQADGATWAAAWAAGRSLSPEEAIATAVH